ncbi:MAG: hypothetical protein EXS58_09235 [Candidatus Latescibacteria bacterium]|nr:hypothetical protein [Candidatus Latescibacterota bacterium]
MNKRWLHLVMLGCLAISTPRFAEGMQAVVGLEYDDNPFETYPGRRGGLVSRFYLDTAGQLLDQSWGGVQVKHQWGFKRFWRGEGEMVPRGEVMASELELEGQAQVFPRLQLSGSALVKVKNVNRISSQDSYLHGGLRAEAHATLGKGWAGSLRYQRSGDDPREADLASLSLQGLGADLSFNRGRRVQARLGAAWRWLDYGRLALAQGSEGAVVFSTRDQRDRERELRLGLNVHGKMLVDAGYALVDNHSNSVGYGFRVHQIELLLSRHLYYGVDGQFYLTTQRRRYNEEITPEGPKVADEEYAQTLLFTKLTRQISTSYSLGLQYSYSRNGTRREEGFFRKHVYGFSLNISF